MRLFESKVYNNTSINYKTKKNEDAFEGKYVEYKSKKEKKIISGRIKKIRQHLRDTRDNHKKAVSGKYI